MGFVAGQTIASGAGGRRHGPAIREMPARATKGRSQQLRRLFNLESQVSSKP
jgi:hypothetical protein